MPSAQELLALMNMIGGRTDAACAPAPPRATDGAPSQKPEPQKVEVVRKGDKIILPEGMNTMEAAAALIRKAQEEETTVAVRYRMDCYPLEGAVAFQRALDQLFGWTELRNKPGLFGSSPPTLIGVPIGPNGQKMQVAWGRVGVPKLSGFFQTQIDFEPPGFIIAGEIRAGDRHHAEALAAATEKLIREQSIYGAKAIRVNWKWKRDRTAYNVDRDSPKYMDVSAVRPEELIFDAQTQRMFQIGILLPIERSAHCRRHGIPLRRSVLLEGPYGVGKTLAADVTALKATQNGWTFIYVENVVDLADAIEFARAYQPAVIFAEDADRVMEAEDDDDRDQEMDRVLNVIDGIESKSAEIMVVLTTNRVNKIAKALLRPGRMDTIISLKMPDAEAASRLVRLYGRELFGVNFDYQAAGQRLAGMRPAGIRECVERCKLIATLRIDPDASPDDLTGKIDTADLLDAAEMMEAHDKLLRHSEQEEGKGSETLKTIAGRFGEALSELAGNGF